MRSSYLVLAACALLAAPLAAQGTATVCKDGSNSAVSGRGACSGHGGVDAKATTKAEKAAKKAATAAAKASKEADKKVTVAKKEEAKAEKASDKAAMTTVTCKDGTSSAGGRGACSGHGGIGVSNPVEKKAEKQETKAAKAEVKADRAEKVEKSAKAVAKASGKAEDHDPAGSIAKCKDGMYSHAANRQGACSRHGGVASWM
ncbi:MAG: DUF3761 domain-containing protein [bacterium]